MLGALEAHAQRADEPTIRSDIGLRRDSRLQAHDWGELRLLTALREVDWKLTLGMAYTHAENGDQVTSTPFQLRARFNEGRTAFKLTGSGYVHVRSEGRSTSGFNDVNVMMTQLVARELIAEGGVTVPAGGEIGSLNGRKRVGAIYNHVFSPAGKARCMGGSRTTMAIRDRDRRACATRVSRRSPTTSIRRAAMCCFSYCAAIAAPRPAARARRWFTNFRWNRSAGRRWPRSASSAA